MVSLAIVNHLLLLWMVPYRYGSLQKQFMCVELINAAVIINSVLFSFINSKTFSHNTLYCYMLQLYVTPNILLFDLKIF